MMMRVAFLVVTLIASLCMPVHADEGNHRFTVALPADRPDATRIHLVLEGVTLPGNRPLKLRVTTVTEAQQTVVLGSAGIVAGTANHVGATTPANLSHRRDATLEGATEAL